MSAGVSVSRVLVGRSCSWRPRPILAKQRRLSDLEQQGLIQAFEFTHELAWNTLKDFLESRGAGPLYGSKDATREGFAKGLNPPW
jgi:hypothetical protein